MDDSSGVLLNACTGAGSTVVVVPGVVSDVVEGAVALGAAGLDTEGAAGAALTGVTASELSAVDEPGVGTLTTGRCSVVEGAETIGVVTVFVDAGSSVPGGTILINDGSVCWVALTSAACTTVVTTGTGTVTATWVVLVEELVDVEGMGSGTVTTGESANAGDAPMNPATTTRRVHARVFMWKVLPVW